MTFGKKLEKVPVAGVSEMKAWGCCFLTKSHREEADFPIRVGGGHLCAFVLQWPGLPGLSLCPHTCCGLWDLLLLSKACLAEGHAVWESGHGGILHFCVSRRGVSH